VGQYGTALTNHNNFGALASEKERNNSMTRFSLSKVLGVALGCSTLVLGGISASAEDFFAHAGTTFILVPVPDTSPQQFTHTVDGVVQVASLGDCTVHFDLIVTATDSSTRPYLVTGTQIITTGDGKSTLTSKVNGYLASNPANGTFLDIHYDLSFTAGTGELANARGDTLLEGFAAIALSPGSEDFPGLPGVDPPSADLINPPSGDLTGKACWIMHGELEH
jgi:hypothetical protein